MLHLIPRWVYTRNLLNPRSSHRYRWSTECVQPSRICFVYESPTINSLAPVKHKASQISVVPQRSDRWRHLSAIMCFYFSAGSFKRKIKVVYVRRRPSGTLLCSRTCTALTLKGSTRVGNSATVQIVLHKLKEGGVMAASQKMKK